MLDSHPWASLGSLRDKGVTQGADILSSKWSSLISHKMLFSRCRRKLTENVVVHFLLPKAWFLAHQGPWSQGRPKEGTTEDMDTWTPLCLSSQGGLLDRPSTWLTSCSLCGWELTRHRWESISEQATRPWASSFCDTWDFLWHIFFINTIKTASTSPCHGSLEIAMRWYFGSFGHGAVVKPQRHIPFLGWETAKLQGHEFLHSAFTCVFFFFTPRNWCRSLVGYDFSSEHGSRYL